MSFTPYLNFGGNCREAFTRYQEIFGGELSIMAMSDMPGDEPLPEGADNLVMNAALKFGDHLLMASDVFDIDDFGAMQYMYVNFTTTDLDQAERVFEALADGGKVEMAMGETFWAPRFGVTVDRFGTPWMVNGESAPEE